MGETASLTELTAKYLRQTADLFGGELYIDTAPPAVEAESPGTLDDFRAEICECVKCPLGIRDSMQGEPFVGRAGQLLDKILVAVNRTRDDVYICNILKCRPPENRTPHQDEIDLCMPYLERQLEMISPKLIVALGATAAQALLMVKTPLGKLRSQVWKWHGMNLVATYHPAALLRNASFKRPTWEDFQWIDELMAEA